eukprot:s4270_g7.t1
MHAVHFLGSQSLRSSGEPTVLRWQRSGTDGDGVLPIQKPHFIRRKMSRWILGVSLLFILPAAEQTSGCGDMGVPDLADADAALEFSLLQKSLTLQRDQELFPHSSRPRPSLFSAFEFAIGWGGNATSTLNASTPLETSSDPSPTQRPAVFAVACDPGVDVWCASSPWNCGSSHALLAGPSVSTDLLPHYASGTETNYQMRVLLLAGLPCLLLAIVTDTDTRSSVAIELKKRRGGFKRRFGSTALTQTDMAYTGKVTVGNPPQEPGLAELAACEAHLKSAGMMQDRHFSIAETERGFTKNLVKSSDPSWGEQKFQEFEVIFDTGSGNLIVPGVNCTVSACTQHRRFDDARSKTSHAHHCDGGEVGSNEVPNDLVVTFGTGEVRFRDRVCLGEKMCAPAKFISSFEESNDPFEWVSFDGILGLGLDSLAQATDFSIMQRPRAAQRTRSVPCKMVLPQEHGQSIKSPLFAFFFARAKEEKSEITFGDIQKDKLGSKMYWFKVSGEAGYWQDIFLDDTAQNICKGCHVAIDTGSSEIAGPQHVIDHLSDKLSIKNCKERAKLPKLGFAIKELLCR